MLEREDKYLILLAGAGGFEPPYGGIKIRCLTTWRRPSAVAACAAAKTARTILAGPDARREHSGIAPNSHPRTSWAPAPRICAQPFAPRSLGLSPRRGAVTDRPIVFFGPMILALLDGRKSEAARRRPTTPQHIKAHSDSSCAVHVTAHRWLSPSVRTSELKYTTRKQDAAEPSPGSSGVSLSNQRRFVSHRPAKFNVRPSSQQLFEGGQC
jgi:hypothetical protein